MEMTIGSVVSRVGSIENFNLMMTDKGYIVPEQDDLSWGFIADFFSEKKIMPKRDKLPPNFQIPPRFGH